MSQSKGGATEASAVRDLGGHCRFMVGSGFLEAGALNALFLLSPVFMTVTTY